MVVKNNVFCWTLKKWKDENLWWPKNDNYNECGIHKNSKVVPCLLINDNRC